MNCPTCQTEMEKGKASVKGTVSGFLIIGLSNQHLWFRTDEEDIRLLHSNETTDAHRCRTCSITVLEEETDSSKLMGSIGKTLGQKYAAFKHRKKSTP